MTTTALNKEAIKANLAADSRDISFIWNEAINLYNQTANDHKEPERVTLTRPTFKDAQAMKNFGFEEMRNFRSWRTKDEKTDKLRTLFMANIDFIDTGSKQLLNAVSASFPPALAISTAMTFVLTGFKSQRADYDVVVNFFEDMNSFLQRVTIIEKRVPAKKAYQNALMDVFTAMLSLCAVARKYVMIGRFKKWVMNSIFGDDNNLKSDRDKLDIYLNRLQDATEYAILENTENMLEQQARLGDVVADMRRELGRNREIQEQIAANQNAATEKISNDVQTMMKDVKKLLALQQEAKSVKGRNVTKSDELSGNVVRHFYGLVLKAKTKPFPDMLAVLANLEKSQIEGVGSWLFEDPAWLDWVDVSKDTLSALLLKGSPGTGKTYLSLSAYQQLCGLRNSEQDICVAYFSCHRPDDQRRHLEDLLRNCAIQIAEQSPTIRRKLEEKWRKFELHAGIEVENSIHTKDNHAFIFDNFQKESKNRLFVIIDNIDEFDEVGGLNDVIDEVHKKKLRIKFVITGNVIEINWSRSIGISKEQILPDIRKILWKRINSEDSAYDSLRKLSRQCKRKVARTVEQNANDLLYVDQMLRFLADVAREGSDIEKLLDVLPANLTVLYEVILEKCLHGLPPEQTQLLKSIFMWLTVSWHPLTTEWVDSLANTASSSSGPQISSSILQFFGIDTLSGDTTSLPDISLAELFEDSTDISTEKSSPPDSLRLQAKNRTIKAFFTDADSKHKLRSSLSDAHRVVFLAAVDIILHRKTTTPKSLFEYSVEHSLMHWHRIVPQEHTEEEQAEICKAFFRLISDDRYAEGLVEHPYCWCLGSITLANWGWQWRSWSFCARALPLPAETAEYWQARGKMLGPLVVALVRHWLRTLDVGMAVKAWIWATGARLGRNDIEKDNLREFKKRKILELAGILGTDLDSRAHFAIASVLALPEIYDIPSAIEELDNALDNCRDASFQTQCYIQLASICIKEERWDDAIENCRLGLDIEHAPTQTSDIVGQTELIGNRESQQSLRVELLRMRAVAMRGLGMNMEAAESFCEARQLSKEIVPAEHIFNELLCLQESPVALIDRLLGFESIDRLHFLTGDSYDLGDGVYLSPTRIILPAIVKSQRVEEVVRVYREIIKALDTEQAGAPVRVDLARILWRLRYDKKDVRLLLNQVLDSVSEERRYKLTDREPMGVAHSALLLMTDILVEEFRSSRKVEDKVQILLQAKELPRRKFLASQPLITDAVWDPHSIAVAQMLRKIGPMSEYEQVMKRVFDKAIDGQSDDTSLNDSVYLISLSRILMMVPSLRRSGEMLYALHKNSAGYKVDKNLDDHNSKYGPNGEEDDMDEYPDDDNDEDADGDDDEEPDYDVEEDLDDNDDEYGSDSGSDYGADVEGNENDKDDKGSEDTSYCDGICLPVTTFDRSNSLEPHYKCLICTNIRLCQSCYETRMRWNADPTPKAIADLDFCCPNRHYMRIPMEGLRGAKSGELEFTVSEEGVEATTIRFTQLIEDIKVAWEKAWEDLASGIE